MIEPQFEIPPSRYSEYQFREELAAFYKFGRMGYINKKGKVVINAKYLEAYAFSEGLALVVTEKIGSQKKKNLKEKIGYINKTGKMVINPQYYVYAGSFQEGLAFVRENKNEYYFINKKGSKAIDGPFNYADSFSEGCAGVNIDGKWKYIDKNGIVVIDKSFETYNLYFSHFSEGLAAVNWRGKYGYIDKSGDLVIKPQFEIAKPFSHGLAAAKQNGKWGYIDRKGNWVISPKYDSAESF